jgi:choline monooxygenase
MGELPAAGSVCLRTVAGVPIVPTRADDGAVRGFLNICRHRGHPVVLEKGTRKTLQCHYHAWSYELDGRLRRAPRSEADPSFDPARFGLVPAQTHVWGPMIWVNADLGAIPFPEWIAGLPELVAQRGLDVTQHVLGFENEWPIAANWKVFQDNTIECYHCPTTHPELSRALEMDPARQEMGIGGPYWIHHRIPFRPGVRPGITYAPPPTGEWFYYYHWIFPTTYLQFSGRGFDVGSVDVVAADRIRFRHLCFLPPGTPPEVLARGKRQLDADATIRQDVEICTRVQAGHATGRAPAGCMLAGTEELLAHFQKRIVEMMAERPARD